MINHARTLLLNRPGKFYMPGIVGEEYISPNYSAVKVPSYIITPHRILFGSDPDRVFANFRAWELLSFIHETELAEFIYALDPRVTYWPQAQTDFFTQKSTSAAIQKVDGYARAQAHVQGQAQADNIRGRAYSEYFIRLAETGDAIKAEITAVNERAASTTPLEFSTGSNNISQSVALPNHESLQLQFLNVIPDTYQSLLLEDFSGTLLTENYERVQLEVGTLMPFTYAPMAFAEEENTIVRWQMQVYTRPDPAIKICLPKLATLGEPLFLELFGVRNDVQPYATFKNIWFDHPMANYRLAAFILAMIYRTHEARGK